MANVAAAMTADSRLFVLEYGIPESAQWLLFLQLSFGELRDHDAIAPLASRAGLAQVRRLSLPDGHVLFEFAVA
ncbi:hypothetical protein [Devosia sp. 2618]|uniref:hypothetical protein n=1 Tax=Devosia sp. 2618 TaxID=3156454 RepID=UPI003399A145